MNNRSSAMNRDTLYSSAYRRHLARATTLSLPDAGDRYLSVMIVNNDHYINDVLRTPPATTN